MLENQGGGEWGTKSTKDTKGADGKIRSKDVIAPGNNPSPPRGKARWVLSDSHVGSHAFCHVLEVPDLEHGR